MRTPAIGAILRTIHEELEICTRFARLALRDLDEEGNQSMAIGGVLGLDGRLQMLVDLHRSMVGLHRMPEPESV